MEDQRLIIVNEHINDLRREAEARRAGAGRRVATIRTRRRPGGDGRRPRPSWALADRRRDGGRRPRRVIAGGCWTRRSSGPLTRTLGRMRFQECPDIADVSRGRSPSPSCSWLSRDVRSASLPTQSSIRPSRPTAPSSTSPPTEIVLTFTEALDPRRATWSSSGRTAREVAAGAIDPDNELGDDGSIRRTSRPARTRSAPRQLPPTTARSRERR